MEHNGAECKQEHGTRWLYLLRHGRPQLPDDRRYYLGQTDLPLSPAGIRQAMEAAAFFDGLTVPVWGVFHSPLVRCRDTAHYISRDRWPCYPVRALQEIAMGQWEMQPMEEIARLYPARYQQRGRQMDTFCPPGGESFVQCQRRAVAALQQLVARQPIDTAMLVVAHAGVNRALLSWMQQTPLAQLLTIRQPYCGITPIVYRQGQWQVGQLIQDK